MQIIGCYAIVRKGRRGVIRTPSALVKLVISAVLRLYKSYWMLIMAEPKCNECGPSGVEHIVSTESNEQSKGGDAWFNIVYCKKCGHIYGVFAKHILSHGITPSMPKLPNF